MRWWIADYNPLTTLWSSPDDFEVNFELQIHSLTSLVIVQVGLSNRSLISWSNESSLLVPYILRLFHKKTRNMQQNLINYFQPLSLSLTRINFWNELGISFLGMIFSMCGLMMRLKWCAWVALYCSCISFANSRISDDTKQVIFIYI